MRRKRAYHARFFFFFFFNASSKSGKACLTRYSKIQISSSKKLIIVFDINKFTSEKVKRKSNARKRIH